MSEPPTRRPPDFLLMVAAVAVCLIAGAVVLVVVPRPAAQTRSSAPTPGASTPAGPTATPTVTAAATLAATSTAMAAPTEACAPDPDAQARIVALPAGAATVPMPQLVGRNDTTKAALLWRPDEPQALLSVLADRPLEACAFRVWQVGTDTVVVAVLRLGTQTQAREIRDLAADDLYYRAHVDIGFFGWDSDQLDRWIQEVPGGATNGLAGVFAVGRYVGFVRLGPAAADDRQSFFDLARRQHDRLGPA